MTREKAAEASALLKEIKEIEVIVRKLKALYDKGQYEMRPNRVRVDISFVYDGHIEACTESFTGESVLSFLDYENERLAELYRTLDKL